MALWQDRRGRFSPLRAGTLVLLVSPALALLYFTITKDLGPRPFTEAIHIAGLWAVRFLMLSLLITPLRRLARYPKLVDVRRMIGVATFCYIALHLSLYIGDQQFNIAKVASEIVQRWYLVFGFIAWLGLATLAITSNDYMVRRLGGTRWRKLHRIVYVIGALGLTHYFMQAKQEIFEPTVVAGLFGWLMLYRVSHWLLPRSFLRSDGELPLWYIGALGVVTAGLVFILEAVGLWLVHGISPLLVLQVDFTFIAGMRPGWYVLIAGAIMLLIGLIRLKPEPRLQLATSSPGRTPS
jgi:methionine sulfoxide reductase heme-binding subunit